MNSRFGGLHRPRIEALAIERCPECGSEMQVPGSEGEVHEELCWGCQERALEVEQQRAKTAEAGARTASIAANPNTALLAAGVPATYAALTRQTWEREYRPWPTKLVPREPGSKGTAEWFMSEMAQWPAGWTVDEGWDDPSRHVDWAVMLHGLYGGRKTGLSTAVAANAMARGALFPEHLVFADMCVWIKLMKRNRFAESDYWWWRAADAPMLIFDDIGAVKDARLDDLERGAKKGWWQYQVAELVRYRYMHAFPTLFTSNGTVEAMAAIDPSLPSRLDVRLQWEVEGQDFRRRAVHGPEAKMAGK